MIDAPSDAHKGVARISGPGNAPKGRLNSLSTTRRQSAAVSAEAEWSSIGLSVRQNAGPISASLPLQTWRNPARLRSGRQDKSARERPANRDKRISRNSRAGG